MMPLVVVENTRRWSLDIPGVEVVPAREYLTDSRYSERRRVTVFNLCRAYGYQTLGYYVSLLAAARGHRPLPSPATIQGLHISPLIRLVSEELDPLIQRSLAPLKSESFDLSVYFGRNVAKRYDRLSQLLFNEFPAPFLRATFNLDGRWRLHNVRVIPTSEIPETHRDFVIEQAQAFLARPLRVPSRKTYRYDLAILYDPNAADSPSNDGAIRKFVRAARRTGMDATLIGPSDYGRIAEFDALFIRVTTLVDHYTYRFARRAAAQGMIVIDDPESIVRCTNKVYQAELFSRHEIPSPRSMVVHEGNVDEVVKSVGLPCVLKLPDSSFSQGVVKIETQRELIRQLDAFFETSDLLIAQEYTPSSFDWRIGVLDGRALYACQYHMVPGHWQIVAADARWGRRWGKVVTMPLEDVPPRIVRLATRSASLFGKGLYGVDIKAVDRRVMVTEVNDNPNIDAGYEDRVLKDRLYRDIVQYFRDRLDARGQMTGSR